MHIVFFHGSHQHGARDCTTQGGGIEVRGPSGANVESATLNSGDAFVCQLGAAIDQARHFGAVLLGFARDFVVVALVGLAQIGSVGKRNGALLAHPQQGCAGIKAARKSDADLLAGG